MMRLFIISILILGFGSVAIFGSFSMHHIDMQGGHTGCLAALSRGMSCFEEINPFAAASFHIEVFKGFSRATFNDGGAFLIIGLLFAAAVIIARQILGAGNLSAEIYRYFRIVSESRIFERDLSFVKWLALHENSPSFS